MRCRRLLPAAAALVLAMPTGAAAQSDPLRARQWGLTMVEAEAAHLTTAGAGATVAIIDTGVARAHPDLQGGRVLSGYDFVSNDGDPADGNGHGTHVLGIVGATAANGIGVSSVAPGASLLPVRVLDNEGNGTSSDVRSGIDYAIAQGADVINLSLSEDIPLRALTQGEEDAIRRALDRGIVVVTSAGNNGLPICEQPGATGRLLCVGAVDRRGVRANYSSFGRGLSIVGPGGSGFGGDENILSTYNNASGYQFLAGTSQASPHVAGVAALLVSLGVRGSAATSRILATASDAGPPGHDGEYGAGIVNARAAVAGLGRPAQAPAPPAQSPASRGRATVSAPRRLRIRAFLRRGIRVRCRAPAPGTCSVLARARRRTIAAGSGAVAAQRTKVIVARPTRAGRRMLRRMRRARRVRVTLLVAASGADQVKRRLTLLR